VTDETANRGWLLISVSTAGATGTLRVQVWRKLRGLGALYIQQSVCLLPARDDVVREVRLLMDRVRHSGGSGRMMRVELVDEHEAEQIIAEMNAARDEEYAEVLERLPAFREELASERARGRATYAEVEESEADLERFRSWLAKIAARDYFGSPGGTAARAAVEQAADALAEFEQAALSSEAPIEPSRPEAS
jgi:hypothetical protein